MPGRIALQLGLVLQVSESRFVLSLPSAVELCSSSTIVEIPLCCRHQDPEKVVVC